MLWYSTEQDSASWEKLLVEILPQRGNSGLCGDVRFGARQHHVSVSIHQNVRQKIQQITVKQ